MPGALSTAVVYVLLCSPFMPSASKGLSVLNGVEMKVFQYRLLLRRVVSLSFGQPSVNH